MENSIEMHLVGGFNHSEKYMKVSWDNYSQYMESHKIPWFQTTNQGSFGGPIGKIPRGPLCFLALVSSHLASASMRTLPSA